MSTGRLDVLLLADKIENQWAQTGFISFGKLAEADAYCRRDARLRVFGWQLRSKGMRFIVTTLYEFWNKYKFMLPEQRRYFELIHPECPCRLYFDIEFSYALNPQADSSRMIELLIKYLKVFLLSKFSFGFSDEEMILLSSDSSEKFSRHLSFDFKCGTAFSSNVHVGKFVAKFEQFLLSQLKHDPEINILFVRFSETSNSKQLFIDKSVYTKNRMFRIYLSSKVGKTSFLVPVGKDNLSEEELFFKSMISLKGLFVSPENLISLPDVKPERLGTKRVRDDVSSTVSSDCKDQSLGWNPQDALNLREYVIGIASTYSTAFIRSERHCTDSQSVVFNIGGSRYCHRIGRSHRSNHVYYIAELKYGIIYQRCTDPDCKGYRSSPIQIPPELITLESKSLEEQQPHPNP